MMLNSFLIYFSYKPPSKSLRLSNSGRALMNGHNDYSDDSADEDGDEFVDASESKRLNGSFKSDESFASTS